MHDIRDKHPSQLPQELSLIHFTISYIISIHDISLSTRCLLSLLPLKPTHLSQER